jgi:DNA repair protein RadC
MSIKTWPRDERPREKLLLRGAEALSDAELLAIFLRTGVKGKSAVDLARELLQQFGDLQALIKAELKEFCRSLGLGPAKYVQLQAVLEISRRYFFTSVLHKETLNHPRATKQYLLSRLSHRHEEVFACLFLNNKNKVLNFSELFSGTIGCANVYPREIIKHALRNNAAAVIFVHNHPSGDPKPSQADIALTKRLQLTLELVDIRVLDHIVVGNNQVVSLAEMGCL